MFLDAETLSRIQFAVSIGFHILFPTLNLGLALFIVIVEGHYLRTKSEKLLNISKYWTKIFALTFGMGVVSGIVLSYQLGTNFAGFTEKVGPVLGPLFGYEVLSAFFLEAGFLGIMLFGWNKVSPKVHYAATIFVWLGTTISAFWIMSANSWMQTPAGFTISDGVFRVSSWLEVVFNPSFITRYPHMLLAAYLTTAFVLMGISAWHLLKKIHIQEAKYTFKIALFSALILAPAQVVMGDLVGLNIYHHQPLKTAAMEGLWETQKGAPLVLFAIPDKKDQKNYYEIKIPKLASLINTHSLDGEMIGLKSVPPSEQPMVGVVFYSFRVMVGLGLLFILLSVIGVYLHFKQKLFSSSRYLKLLVWCTPLGFIATLAGWFVAETGRQPWVVYGLIRTLDSVSVVNADQVFFSLGLFIIAYVITFAAYLYYLFKLIKIGPDKAVDAISPPSYTYVTTELVEHAKEKST